MTIVVTGATGHLGRLTVESLLAKGVPANDILATGRSAEKLAQFAESGVGTAQVDLADQAALKQAFTGVDSVLLISGSEPGNRVALHRNAIEAAQAAGVKHLVYTSAPKATTTELILAPDHKATEELILASGLPYTILRNGWYTENYANAVDQAKTSGVVAASVGDGRVASASRKDYAEAAAVVLTQDGHLGKTYELSGDVAWNFDELAGTVGAVIGRDVAYVRLTPEEQLASLREHGLDEGTAGFVVALDGNTRDDLLAETSGDLRTLIGRPTTPLAEGIRAIVG